MYKHTQTAEILNGRAQALTHSAEALKWLALAENDTGLEAVAERLHRLAVEVAGYTDCYMPIDLVPADFTDEVA